MQVEIKIDESCKEPKIIIYTREITDEINTLVKQITEIPLNTILGFQNERIEILQPEDVVRIYSANQKVYAQTEQATYTLKSRLYEMENTLDKRTFVRISNSEIVNLKKVKNMDLSFTGTICINLKGNIKTFVSRRYVPRIKQLLGI